MNTKTQLDALYQSVYEYCGREIRESYKSDPQLANEFLSTPDGIAFSLLYTIIDRKKTSCSTRTDEVYEHCYDGFDASEIPIGKVVHAETSYPGYIDEIVCFVTYGFNHEPDFGLIHKSSCTSAEWNNDLLELIVKLIIQKMVYLARKVIDNEIGAKSDHIAMKEFGFAPGTVIKNIQIGEHKASRIEVTDLKTHNGRIMVSYKLFKRGTRNYWLGTSYAGAIRIVLRNRDLLKAASDKAKSFAVDLTSDSHPQLSIF